MALKRREKVLMLIRQYFVNRLRYFRLFFFAIIVLGWLLTNVPLPSGLLPNSCFGGKIWEWLSSLSHNVFFLKRLFSFWFSGVGLRAGPRVRMCAIRRTHITWSWRPILSSKKGAETAARKIWEHTATRAPNIVQLWERRGGRRGRGGPLVFLLLPLPCFFLASLLLFFCSLSLLSASRSLPDAPVAFCCRSSL